MSLASQRDLIREYIKEETAYLNRSKNQKAAASRIGNRDEEHRWTVSIQSAEKKIVGLGKVLISLETLSSLEEYFRGLSNQH